MKNLRSIISPTVALTVICLVVAVALALTYSLTKPMLQQRQQQTATAANKKVMPDAHSFNEKKIDAFVYYEAVDEDGKVIGYVFDTTAKGYSSEFTIKTGISSRGKIVGIDLLNLNETPGLGQNALEDDFLNQYKTDVPKGGFSVVKSDAQQPDQILALTGATITAQAVTNGVNKAIEIYTAVRQGKTTVGETEEDINKRLMPDAAEFTGKDSDGVKYFEGKDSSGNIIGYIINTKDQGFGGEVFVKTAISKEGVILGIDLTDISMETPRYAQQATKPEFTDQYKKPIPQNKFKVVQGSAANPEDIVSITGATITSTGITNAVNTAVEVFNSITEGK